MNKLRIKIFTFFTVFLLFVSGKVHAQSLPYYNGFDNLGDTIGWTHYAITGTDNWKRGKPQKTYLNQVNSAQYAWCTNLTGSCTPNSIMCLETPTFNLSDTSKKYALSFYHNYFASPVDGLNVEYSINGGNTWLLLNGLSTEKSDWYNNPSCSGNGGQPTWSWAWFSTYIASFHSLKFLAGQASVKFRFKFGCASAAMEGWSIDDFKIFEDKPNLWAKPGPYSHTTRACGSFGINHTFCYLGVSVPTMSNTVKYYLSKDSIYDAFDVNIGSKSLYINKTQNGNWSYSVTAMGYLPAGKYWIFTRWDFLNDVTELDENDNLCKSVLIVDSVFSEPVISSFDNSLNPWTKGGAGGWQFGPSNVHHYEGTHSGQGSWNIFNYAYNDVNYIQSDLFNSSTQDSTLVSFWYRSKNNLSPVLTASLGCYPYYDYQFGNLKVMKNNTWDCQNYYLPKVGDTASCVRIALYNGSQSAAINLVVDDIYIGKAKPDLTIENDKLNRFTATSLNSDTVKYYLSNGGIKPALSSKTAFYWSNDSILDATDVLLGVNIEPVMPDTTRIWRKFVYTKPTTTAGKYFIFYYLDSAKVVDEMREYNNKDYFVLYQDNKMTFPYFNDFETQINGWRHNFSIGPDEWKWTSNVKSSHAPAFSGVKAWISNDTGIVSPMTRMHLYTPVFDFSSAIKPVLEFDLRSFSANFSYGMMNMSYSLDGGATWIVLDTTSQSFDRWYYPMDYDNFNGIDKNYFPQNSSSIMFDLFENTFTHSDQYNSRDNKRTTRQILDISFLAGKPNVQFRYNLASGKLASNYFTRGAMIDNFTLREAFVDFVMDYKKSLMFSSKSQRINFFANYRNQGNYFSKSHKIEYYLSSDSLLSSGDFYLGDSTLGYLRPDLYRYINQSFLSPSNLSIYKYLIFKLDATNSNIESIETNNTMAWPLAMDSIKSYPYYNSFNDSIVNGWHQYSLDFNNKFIDNYRFRNMIAPSEPIYQTKMKSGIFFTERRLPDYFNKPPSFYLQSPAFDFSNVDSIFLSFRLYINGQAKGALSEGGNIDYSLDGGNTWQLLDTIGNKAYAYNWYNNTAFNTLLWNQNGWCYDVVGSGSDLLDSVSRSISFLKGKKDVTFRYKYKCNLEPQGSGGPSGMRIDDFRIKAYTVDYKANDNFVPIQNLITQTPINLNYSISNLGQAKGKTTHSHFYWSNDSILDASDTWLQADVLSPIASNTTYSAIANITPPSTVTPGKYYVFYYVDADSLILETNEKNNVGSFKIELTYINYVAPLSFVNDTAYISQSTFSLNYTVANVGNYNGINSTTDFYWSNDSIFDPFDSVLTSISESVINAGVTYTAIAGITYTNVVSNPYYFVFYKADSGNGILETNENDNVGSYRVYFINDVGINENQGKNQSITLYPNPNNGEFIINTKFLLENGYVEIYNSIGEIIIRKSLQLRTKINLNEFSNGIYFVRILQNNSTIHQSKIVKE